ncbi:MAG: DNA polymerase I [Planctomycetes bacterium]|nr:DNA polymerase I [Planctomycetota bacterium]
MSREKDKVLFLVDGSALAYRSYFAFLKARLSNGKGLETGAIYGYTRTLLRIIARENPSHMAVVFDTPQPTFRHELFPDYKATREKMPPEMREQLPYMRQVTEALAIPLLEKPGFEADDVIGTLARRAAAEGFFVNIVTGDKDFMQIVGEDVVLYDIMKSGSDLIIVDPAKVVDKFGVPPERVIDVLALMGDSSDNVPGVAGVGEKTALDLITTFGSVEAALDRAEEYPKKAIRQKLIDQRDMALLSKELVTIRTDLDLDLAPEDLHRRAPDMPRLDPLLKELAFDNLRAEFLDQHGKKEVAVEKDYRIIRDEAGLEALITRLEKVPIFVVDLETTSLDVLSAEIVGFAFSVQAGQGIYVPLNLDPPVLPDPLGFPRGTGVIERLRPLLENPKIGKCGQNIKYDLAVMRTAGLEPRGIRFDTMLASYLIDPGSRDHNLDSLALRHFDYTKIKTTELIGEGDDQITMAEVAPELVGEYAAEDADFTWRLYEHFDRQLGPELHAVMDRLEAPLIPVLEKMERAGIRLDKAVLAELEAELDARLEGLMAEIHALAGREFSINSPKQLSEILFDELALHEKAGIRLKKTKTGWSTNQEVLEALGASPDMDHPLPGKILEYRGVAKLLSTYVRALPGLVRPEDGRIHSSFNQAVAATGRLSSSDPNLQNIPIRSPLGRRVRGAFVAREPGYLLLSADYSQVELRIMAHVSGDEFMIRSFEQGADIHRDTAARIFGVEPAAVDGDMRARAKSINFGIMYGMGPQRLARETRMSPKEAEGFIQRYFDNFPSVRAYLEDCKAKARRDGYVTTIFGRRRPIPDIDSSNGRLRAAAENMAVNTPIQGAAADLIKMAMIEIDRWIEREGLRGQMILQVHDELVFDLPEDELATFRDRVPAIMAGAADLAVPLVVELGQGFSWAEAH